MKRSDTVWGIKCNDNVYWLFRGTDPDNPTNQIRLPGADYTTNDNKVRARDLGVTVHGFHGLLRPDRQALPRLRELHQPVRQHGVGPEQHAHDFTLTGGGETRTIDISPETGLVQ